MSTEYPIPSLSVDTRAELDIKSGELYGLDFEDLVARCRAGDDAARRRGGTKGWRPVGRGTLALRIALEVALHVEPDDDDTDDADGRTTAKKIVELLSDSIYLPEEDHWVLGDGSVLDIGDGIAEAKPGAVESR